MEEIQEPGPLQNTNRGVITLLFFSLGRAAKQQLGQEKVFYTTDMRTHFGSKPHHAI